MTEKYKKYVDIGLRVNNVSLHKDVLDIVIATIELIQTKGGKATIKDTSIIKVKKG